MKYWLLLFIHEQIGQFIQQINLDIILSFCHAGTLSKRSRQFLKEWKQNRPWLVKSPKQRLETYCFCSVSYYYYYYYSFFPCTMNLSTADLRNYRTKSVVYSTNEGSTLTTRYDYNLTIMKSPKPATDTIYPHIKFWKWQTSWKFWKCRIAPLMVTYHYVKFIILSFRAPWTCPRQISGTIGQNFMKLGGVIDICF
jgi:hypothetical protein